MMPGAAQAEFQKRPLWDYKAGEELEGTVTGLRKRAAFVDVGAMVDAYFPEENWGELEGKLELGQKLKFRIEKVMGSRIVLEEAWVRLERSCGKMDHWCDSCGTNQNGSQWTLMNHVGHLSLSYNEPAWTSIVRFFWWLLYTLYTLVLHHFPCTFIVVLFASEWSTIPINPYPSCLSESIHRVLMCIWINNKCQYGHQDMIAMLWRVTPWNP